MCNDLTPRHIKYWPNTTLWAQHIQSIHATSYQPSQNPRARPLKAKWIPLPFPVPQLPRRPYTLPSVVVYALPDINIQLQEINRALNSVMADPFIGIGLNLADTLIDKHFDKIPDKLMPFKTDKPKSPTESPDARRSKTGRSTHPPTSNWDLDIEDKPGSARDTPPRSGYASPHHQPSPYGIPPQYSGQPSRQRPRYTPQHEQHRYLPSPPQQFQDRGRDRYPYGHNQSPYPRRPNPALHRSSSYEVPRSRNLGRHSDKSPTSSYRTHRPKVLSRRSNSYHGRDRLDRVAEEHSKRDNPPRRDRSLTSSTSRTHRHTSKDGDDKTHGEYFTSSKAGLAGSALGAALGGWAVHKAQGHVQKNKNTGEGDSKMPALLGAAVGGLAANAVVEHLEQGTGRLEIKDVRNI
ncbi:uncharacterized protein BP5553_09672 [Venustampulla echinocandica]|uniref:Glycine zipper 2TM domain-containing protein n=1 Tax=Venustampulla echinocandica TaxID=2656787 RepID=A0A370TBP2_9HELO|nr:uncharacterized protein BP5553_09672 [Venustampulla echinocandica]RDL31463.1 hypothetical protein BP5553_09672 [Venustampulla echinocandica]